MKRFYFLILIGTVPTILSSQPGIRQHLDHFHQELNISEITEWEKYRRSVYSYDTNGNYAEINSYWWSTDTNDWYIYYHHDYYYDTNGNKTDHYDYEWSKLTREWVGQHHDKYMYDSLGNKIEDIRWASDPGVVELVEYWRHLYTYDTAGYEIERLNYRWGYGISEWIATERSIMSYDTSGNLTEIVSDYWDLDSNNWKPRRRRLITCDIDGNRTEQLFYNWDPANSWVVFMRWVYTYDIAGNNTNGWSYNWDTLNNKWIEDFHSWDTYIIDNSNGNILEQYSYSEWILIDTGDTITSAEYFTYTYEHGNRIEKIEYKWTDPATSEENNILEDNAISVFPNPVTDQITIQASEIEKIQHIEMIDSHGRILRRIQHPEGKSITLDRENLPSGLYFIRIYTDKTYIKKVIIR